jgi:NADPH:quinone reductase-like Zn-dependent oxidoreductase
MKAIHLTKYEYPTVNLQQVEVPEPGAPGADEILVRVNYSPVNYSDLLTAWGFYFILPPVPAVIGGEGAGTVEQVGSNVTDFKPGDKVALPPGPIAWAELVKAPAKDFFLLPDAIDLKQASMININPTTAALMLSETVKLEKGDWVIFNGANSATGKSLIAIAKERGIKTVAIVRRQEVVEEVLSAGADVVLVESPEVPAQIKEATGGANIRLALDAVGGDATDTLAKSVGFDAHILVYAQMSGKPIFVNLGDLNFKRMSVEGFWMYYPRYVGKHKEIKAEITDMMVSGKISVPISKIYQPSEIDEAVAHTLRGGKVLLEFSK